MHIIRTFLYSSALVLKMTLMPKYTIGKVGPKQVPAIVLAEGQEGVIKCLQYSKGGDWITTERGTAPIWPRYSEDMSVRTLGHLTSEEFAKIRDSIPGIPGDELEQCYQLAVGESQWKNKEKLEGLYSREL